MDFGQRRDPRRRLAGFLGVGLLHLGLLWLLVNGLVQRVAESPQAVLMTRILTPPKPVERPQPPPPPPPQAPRPRPKPVVPPPAPWVPPPEVRVDPPPVTPATITGTPVPAQKPLPSPAVPEAPAAAVAGPARRAPVVKASACRMPEYPSTSARLGETGTVVLQLLVGIDGKVTDSKVEKSSGHERLDRAAQKALSLCKFEPGTADGVPVPAWARIGYSFRPD